MEIRDLFRVGPRVVLGGGFGAACAGSACFDKRATDRANGKAASTALENCTVTNCKDACGL